MDQGTLVSEQIADGRRLLQRLAEENVAVTAAGWVKESESGHWYLYIATSLVTDGVATREAYGRIYAVMRQMPPPFWVEPSEVKAIAPSSPRAEAMAYLHTRYPGRDPIRYDGYRLGDVSVEGAYIYPPVPAPVP